ncbi:MAG: bifunctional rhamnulose-1-phosphate aldolase/short-chain dehydrogenase, partial [Solirubrobacteraceae bacterium]
MTEVVAPRRGIPAPLDRWTETPAPRDGVLADLVYRSRLYGADRALANQGGGNTSAKEMIHDHTGRATRVMWVKASGTDLATIEERGFTCLQLDDLELLRERDAMDDAAMVDYLLC